MLDVIKSAMGLYNFTINTLPQFYNLHTAHIVQIENHC